MPQIRSVDGLRRFRAYAALAIAFVCVGMFFLNNPWAIRDGHFALSVVYAGVWLICGVGFSLLAISVSGQTLWFRLICLVPIVVLACVPLTWRYLDTLIDFL